MWSLFQLILTPVSPAVEDQALKDEIARSQSLKEEISQMMAQMAEMGFQDSQEYQAVMAAYQKLSRQITEASRDLRSREAQQVQEARATGELLTKYNYTGINPVKGTLGPPGRRGVVSKGEEVLNLQKFLNAVGASVPETGTYDGETRNAVLKFQTTYGLHADGQVGAETRMLINSLVKGQ